MSGLLGGSVQPYVDALSAFTVVDGLVWAAWWAWMAFTFRAMAVADAQRDDIGGAAFGLWMAVGLMGAALAFLALGLGLGHGERPTAWSILGMLGWLLGWMNLDRLRTTGKPWI